MDVLFEKSEKFEQQKIKKNLKKHQMKTKQTKRNIIKKKGKITATTNQEEGIKQEQIKKYQNIYELSIEKNMQLLCVINN